jgi:hypothetical protein
MAIATSSRRVIMRIELNPSAKKALTDLCDHLGMTQIATTSRIIEWFAAQPDVVQAAILGLYPQDIRGEVAEIILKRLTNDHKKRS